MKSSEPPRQYAYNLDTKPENYLELWKWFSEDTAKVKDKMWTMAAFFYPVLGTLLGFIGNSVTTTNPLQLKSPALLLFASLIGIVLSGYAMYMIWEYGRHIQTGWDRTNYLRSQIKGLTPIWFAGDTEQISKELLAEKLAKEEAEKAAKERAEKIAEGKIKSTDTKNGNRKTDILKSMRIPPIARRLIWLLFLFLIAFSGTLAMVMHFGNH